MKHLAAMLLAMLALTSCSDDQVILARGPLGPSRYEVEVRAQGDASDLRVHRLATLRIDPRPPTSADFALRIGEGSVIRAKLRRNVDGSVDLEDVRGVPVDSSGEAELASLVGQLTPPLPREPVRLGERWSSTQRIRTTALRAALTTDLGIARYRRIASTDTAELRGTVTGQLRTTGRLGILSGSLDGRTRIAWAVHAGRVVAAETKLVWTLRGGDHVTLETTVRPR